MAGRNAALVGSIADGIAAHRGDGVVVVVTNPVDLLTHVVLKRLGWPRRQVVGSGTVLDTARLRHLLSRFCRIDVRNVHAYVIGEHGDS